MARNTALGAKNAGADIVTAYGAKFFCNWLRKREVALENTWYFFQIKFNSPSSLGKAGENKDCYSR